MTAMYYLKFCYSFLLFTALQNGCWGSRSIIRKLEMCDKNYKYPVTFQTAVNLDGETTGLNITAFVNVPFGYNQGLNATFEFSPDGAVYVPLFKFRRDVFCDFFNKDLGPFWFDIQRRIGLPSGSCPLPVGRYNLINYELPYNKMRLPLPAGFVRCFLYVTENKTNKVITCLMSLTEIRYE